MTCLRLLTVASGLLVLTACNAFDETRLDSTVNCEGRRPPAPPPSSMDGDDGQEYVVVLRDIFLNQEGDMMQADTMTEPWRSIGFNQDGRCTSEDNIDVACQPARSGFSPEYDGVDGIDNTFGHKFYPLLTLATRNMGIDIEEEFQNSQEAGLGAIVFRITGWNGERNDASVNVAVSRTTFMTAAAAGGGMPAVDVSGTQGFVAGTMNPVPAPNWDGNDYVWLDESTYITDMFPEIEVTASVTDGIISAGVPARTELLLFGQGIGASVVMSELVAAGDIYALFKDPGMAPIELTVAGRWAFTDMLATARHIDVCPDSSLFNILNSQLLGLLDVLADPPQDGEMVDTTVPCDAISVGVTFNAYPANVGGFAGELVLPDPCATP